MNAGGVLADGLRVYALLFRRSVTIAVLVYGVIAGLEEASGWGAAVLAAIASWGGPVIVQGALVEIVRSVHEGRRPPGMGNLLRRAAKRFLPLFGASLLYAFGVLGGLVLLVVPGLLAASRWCLLAPGIMLEERKTFDALERSRRLVRGAATALGDQTWRVLTVVLATFVLTVAVPDAIVIGSFGFGDVRGWEPPLVSAAISAVTAPYAAHILSVIYYRLVDPVRPTVHPDVRRWPSVWEGPA